MSGTLSSLLVFSDLDGSLLDEETYSFDPAREALAAISAAQVPLVLCSSKTRREVTTLLEQIGLVAPFIIENGSAIVIPRDWTVAPPEGATLNGPSWTLTLGVPATVLAEALVDIGQELQTSLRGFSQMTVEGVSGASGLSLEAAQLARAREYDEPFTVEGPVELQDLERLAQARGLRVTRGGRFFHLMGPTDKGLAARRLLAELASQGRLYETTAALGDSPNDLELLRSVDIPIIIPRPNGEPDAELTRGLPHARIASCPGPKGWNAAVLALLGELNPSPESQS